MYRIPKYHKTTLTSVDKTEGETIETKVERIVNNGEKIKDGAPIIFTEKKEGVISAYNIRTDTWEIAAEAMDAVHRSELAKKDGKPKLAKEEPKEEGKVIDMPKDGGTESAQGTK